MFVPVFGVKLKFNEYPGYSVLTNVVKHLLYKVVIGGGGGGGLVEAEVWVFAK